MEGGDRRTEQPVGVILAGGRGRRLGGVDKALTMLGDRPILTWIIDHLAPQCDGLLLNANGDPARFAGFGLPVIADPVHLAGSGPLAGVLAGLDAIAARRPAVPFVLTVTGDTPFLPDDLVRRLGEARKAAGVRLAAAATGSRTHPLTALWSVALREPLRRLLQKPLHPSAHAVVESFGVAWAPWPDTAADLFQNINTPDDLAAARRWLAGQPR